MKIKTAKTTITKTIIEVTSAEFFMDFTEAIVYRAVADNIDDRMSFVAIDALNRGTSIFQGTATPTEVNRFFRDGYTLMAIPGATEFFNNYTGNLENVEMHITFPASHKREPYIVSGIYSNY
jgi:hypothetical protein